MVKKIMYNNSHLTLEDRKVIQLGIEQRLSKVDISKLVLKDPSTVAKEIKSHRKLRPRNIFYAPSMCIHNKKCGGCKKRCQDYEEIKCNKRDHSPGACNKCPSTTKCHLDKYFYSALDAQETYRYTLLDSRIGINLNTTERKEIADTIVPLINQGQSIYQILSTHKEITQCEKTLYNYIDMGVFNDYEIINLSLKEKVGRKQFKQKYKKRKEPANYTDRKYSDYLEFVTKNPNIPTVEMDTVMNSLSGPYIQTFIFEKTGLMIGFLHKEKTSVSMANTLNTLQNKLGINYYKLFSLILTDRGVEFEKNNLFEINSETGEIRSNIFYCDPMNSSQKPHIEGNHNYVRDIIPNGLDISNITQQDLELMFSHINSTPRESLNGRSPYEVFEFMYENEILNPLNVQKIERDKVTLKPYLLKNHVHKSKI